MALAAAEAPLSSASTENACEVMLLRGNFGDLMNRGGSAGPLESMRFCSTLAFPHRNPLTSRSVASRSGKTPCWTCEWTRVDKP